MPSVTPRTMRRVRKLLEELSDTQEGSKGTTLGDLWRLAPEASALLPLLGQRKPPKKALPFLKRKDAKRAKAATRRERVGEIREAVRKRADGRCELCGFSVADYAAEMHHLESGSGRRRSEEAAHNTLWVHTVCHRSYHRGPAVYAIEVADWAARHGYPVPKRIAALLDAAEAQP